MKSLNYARFKFLRFIYFSFLLSLLVVVFCGFAPAEASASTRSSTSLYTYRDFSTVYTNSVDLEGFAPDSDSYPEACSYSLNIYNNQSSTYRNYAGYLIKITITNFDSSFLSLAQFTYNSATYTGSTSATVLDIKSSLNSFDNELVLYLACPSYYYSPASTYASLSFSINTSDTYSELGQNSFLTFDYTVELLSPADIGSGGNSYLDGYNAGISFADSRVNTDSASYLAGYNNALEYANATVNPESASYLAGYNAGLSLTYEDGYNAGISYADSRVNTDSASYRSGYSAGYEDGLAVGAGFAQNGLFYNSTLTIDMTLTTDDGEADRIIPTFQLSANPFLLNYSIDFAQLRSYLESNYLTPTYELIKELTLTVSFDQDIIFIADVYRFYGNFGSIGITGYFTDNTGLRYVIYGDLRGQLNSEYLKEFWYTLDDIDGKYISSFTLTFKAAYTTFEGSVDSVSGGYQSGYIAGYNDGKSDGSKEGYQKGYDKGVNSIKDLSELEAFQKGYDKALADNPPGFHFNTLLAGISDSVVGTITGLLNFEILGVNLMSLFGSVLVILIATFIIKRFI